MMRLLILFIGFSVAILLGCKDEETIPGSIFTGTLPPAGTPSWLIPSNEVFDGGPGKDGIPSVDDPSFISVSEVTFLDDADLVVGMVINGVAKAYPHAILDWHEIVNDQLANSTFALTYCPLTGTGIAWDQLVNGIVTTFGVSGKLYNTNLMPYDRETDSYWSQMGLNCVNGPLIGAKINTLPTIETTWKTWKASYPNSKVMSTNTGYSRNYQVYPYGNYNTDNDQLIFPVSVLDDRLPAKERVLGVFVEGKSKVYSINAFENAQVITDVLNGEEVLIFGSKADNFMVAYLREGLQGVTIDLSNFPIVAKSEDGNAISISGEIISGPMKGKQLASPVAYIGFWFAFGTFHSQIQIY